MNRDSPDDPPEGVLLRPIKPFPATQLEDVAGCAGYRGPRKSVEQMDAAVAAMARKQK